MAAAFPAAFLRGVADMLLPGDAALPSAGAAGVALDAPPAHEAVLLDIARRIGGAEAFIAATPAQRSDAIRACAAANAEAFRALLLPLLADYYESDAVLTALGWRSAPPQPQGHALAAMDAATRQRLVTVRRRGPIWRRG